MSKLLSNAMLNKETRVMGDEPEFYRSYLLRIWRGGDAATPVWRLLIEDVRSHERRGFSSLEQLLAFLQEQAGMRSPPRSTPRDDEKVKQE
jgi:hypothetical protein